MRDRMGREINYLRISVTDRCNLRCRYCMPEGGTALKPHDEILRLEEIARLVNIFSDLGIRKVRLTGGEPLVRRNLPELVRMIHENPLIDDIALTTNGLLFAKMAGELKEAGLNRVNLSLDTLRPDRYEYITRGGDLGLALNALETALAEGLHPVKINTVVISGFNDDEILDFCRLAYQMPVHVRFIELMPVGELSFWSRDRMLGNDEVKTRIESQYQLKPAKIKHGSGPARYYNIEGGQGSIGFISPMSHQFCHLCNRLRLTADGRLRACLYSPVETDLKKPLRSGAGDEEIKALFLETVASKPEKHGMGDKAWARGDRKMSQIGG